MTRTDIALLRGINVGGKRPVTMAELRAALEQLGATGIRTYLQSGNVLLTTQLDSAGAVAELVREAARISAGLDDVDVTVRAADDLARIVEGMPMWCGDADEKELHVTFLAAVPDEAEVEHPSPDSGDEFEVAGDVVYVRCPDGYGETKLTNTFFEKALGVSATTRNWRTLSALAAMTGQGS